MKNMKQYCYPHSTAMFVHVTETPTENNYVQASSCMRVSNGSLQEVYYYNFDINGYPRTSAFFTPAMISFNYRHNNNIQWSLKQFRQYTSTWSLETASKRHHHSYGPPRLSTGADKYVAGTLHSEAYRGRSREEKGISRLTVRSASRFRWVRDRKENPRNL